MSQGAAGFSSNAEQGSETTEEGGLQTAATEVGESESVTAGSGGQQSEGEENASTGAGGSDSASNSTRSVLLGVLSLGFLGGAVWLVVLATGRR